MGHWVWVIRPSVCLGWPMGSSITISHCLSLARHSSLLLSNNAHWACLANTGPGSGLGWVGWVSSTTVRLATVRPGLAFVNPSVWLGHWLTGSGRLSVCLGLGWAGSHHQQSTGHWFVNCLGSPGFIAQLGSAGSLPGPAVCHCH